MRYITLRSYGYRGDLQGLPTYSILEAFTLCTYLRQIALINTGYLSRRIITLISLEYMTTIPPCDTNFPSANQYTKCFSQLSLDIGTVSQYRG